MRGKHYVTHLKKASVKSTIASMLEKPVESQ
jgi:hypothetical protein